MEDSKSNGDIPIKVLEEQYPSMPFNTRVCIVGGGPSGLAAAYALSKLGYINVTLLEQHHTVGGMCETLDYEGKKYDLGGQVLASGSSPNMQKLIADMDIEMVDMTDQKIALIDVRTGQFEDLKLDSDYMSLIPNLVKMQARSYYFLACPCNS